MCSSEGIVALSAGVSGMVWEGCVRLSCMFCLLSCASKYFFSCEYSIIGAYGLRSESGGILRRWAAWGREVLRAKGRVSFGEGRGMFSGVRISPTLVPFAEFCVIDCGVMS
jgi:hypothetical protein